MERFWSDNFDMDLLKLWPDLPEQPWLAQCANTPVWTYGNTTHGRLNHPTCWNGDGGVISFFWLTKPQHVRDQGGWVSIYGSYVDDSPMVEATWLEVLRDWWPHGYSIILEGRYTLRHDSQSQTRFMQIMHDLRGVFPLEPETRHAERLLALNHIRNGCVLFAHTVERHSSVKL